MCDDDMVVCAACIAKISPTFLDSRIHRICADSSTPLLIRYPTNASMLTYPPQKLPPNLLSSPLPLRYNEAIGKNDGVVKGVRLFTCQPNHGVLVRPDKITVLAHKGQKTPQRPSTTENHSSSPSSLSSPFLKPGSRPSTPSSSESPAHFYNPDSKNNHGDPDVVIGSDPSIEDIMPRNRVGLAYDERMGAHKASCGYHPEQPARIKVKFSTRVERICRDSMTNMASSSHK